MMASLWASRTRYLDLGRNFAALFLFVVFPFAQVLVPRSTPFFFALAVISILAFGLMSRWRGEPDRAKPAVWPPKPVGLVFGAFLLLMVVSLLWSPLPERGAKDVAVLLVMCFSAVLLMRHLPEVTLLQLPFFVHIALIISSIGLILECWGITSLHDAVLDTNFIYDLNRNASWLIVVGCAALVFFERRKISGWSAVLTGLLIVFAVFSSQGEAAKLALIAAFAAALIALYSRVLVKPLFVIFAALILAMPILAGVLTDGDGRKRIPLPLDAHAGHRIALWQGYADLVGQRPFLGWGTKADRAHGASGEAAKLAAQRGFPAKTTSPHNVALEIWVNHGAVGAILAAFGLLVAGWRLAGLQRWSRISAVAMVTAIFTVSMTGSSFYQGWWIATIATGFVIWGSTVRSAE